MEVKTHVSVYRGSNEYLFVLGILDPELNELEECGGVFLSGDTDDDNCGFTGRRQENYILVINPLRHNL